MDSLTNDNVSSSSTNLHQLLCFLIQFPTKFTKVQHKIDLKTSSFSISYIVSLVLLSPLCPHKSSFALNRKIYSVAKRNLTVSSDVIYKSLTRVSLVLPPPAPKFSFSLPRDERNLRLTPSTPPPKTPQTENQPYFKRLDAR